MVALEFLPAVLIPIFHLKQILATILLSDQCCVITLLVCHVHQPLYAIQHILLISASQIKIDA